MAVSFDGSGGGAAGGLLLVRGGCCKKGASLTAGVDLDSDGDFVK